MAPDIDDVSCVATGFCRISIVRHRSLERQRIGALLHHQIREQNLFQIGQRAPCFQNPVDCVAQIAA